MKPTGEFGGDFQNLVERSVREHVMERLVDIGQGHGVGEAFEDEFYGEARAADGQLTAAQFGVEVGVGDALVASRT